MTMSPSFEEVLEAKKHFALLHKEYWLYENLWTWQWWLILFVSIAPWFLWWKLLDKKRLFEILTFGLMLLSISVVLDIIGDKHLAWAYPMSLHWTLTPPLKPYDITIIPVTYMLVYQYCHSWRSFFVGMVIVSTVFAFIAEPFLIWIDVYMELTWKHIYSFPIYIFIGLLAKWVVDKLTRVQQQHRREQ